MHKIIRFLLLCTVWLGSISFSHRNAPQVTVVIIIDQFAYSYLYKIKPYLSGGLKTLMQKGIFYQNAHHAHAMPETAVGHAAISTGTFAIDHGIIANSWFDKNGNPTDSDDDDPITAAVFKNKHETYNYGKGPRNLMVENITDQFVLQSKPDNPYLAFALSIKSRAAILCASKLGKAIWFDKQTGRFTSSKAYFKHLPHWLTTFNAEHNISALNPICWNLALDKKTGAYAFQNIENYTFASEPSMINKTFFLPEKNIENDPYVHFYTNPISNQYLLDLAQTCIQECLTPKTHMLLWISLSSLDLIGHRFGPDSLEAIDTIYHIDQQLQHFMQYVHKKVGKKNTLWVLTADHGVLPMQGILQLEGISTAHKLSPETLISDMNAHIEHTHGFKNMVTHFQMPQFYLNSQITQEMNLQELDAIGMSLKKFLLNVPGIKNAWTDQDLNVFSFDPTKQELETYFKNQRYPGRSGNVFVQLQPYTLLSKYSKGTTHESPYTYDTHVPLVIYQPGSQKHSSVIQKVYLTQLANTLAQILGTRKPPASTAQVLPGIFDTRKRNTFGAHAARTKKIMPHICAA